MLTSKMRLKGCPRCAGDLMPDRSDASGNTLACLQCGREFSATAFAAAQPQTLTVAAAPVAFPLLPAA